MIEKTLYTAISALGVALFPLIAPQEQKQPWVNFARLRTKPTNSLKGTNSRNDNADFQVNVFSPDYLRGAEIAEQIINRMRVAFEADSLLQENKDEPYDSETGTYHRMLVFSLREINTEGGS